ncbi:transcription initiation protein [Plantibacter flavus]|uniref:YciI family protein n=1 Tax=Plantibacter flavus TaxID=150123 RepID=UPI003F151161
MTKYLISFPSAALVLSPEDLPEVVESSHAVVREAKHAGVWVFGGGIDEGIPPVLVDASGVVDSPPTMTRLDGGLAVIDVDSPEEAREWAARFARGCRCPQELRAFGDDPDS